MINKHGKPMRNFAVSEEIYILVGKIYRCLYIGAQRGRLIHNRMNRLAECTLQGTQRSSRCLLACCGDKVCDGFRLRQI